MCFLYFLYAVHFSDNKQTAEKMIFLFLFFLSFSFKKNRWPSARGINDRRPGDGRQKSEIGYFAVVTRCHNKMAATRKNLKQVGNHEQDRSHHSCKPFDRYSQ